MGNPYTGEIYPLAEGENPKQGDLLIDADTAERLQQMQVQDRIAALFKLRDEMPNKGDY